MRALLPRQTEPSVIKEYDAQVEVIETLAAALQNSTRSLMPLTDATLTQDGITGWSGCDVIRVSLYIYIHETHAQLESTSEREKDLLGGRRW